MSIPNCPKCKRKTYSPKFGTCTACGYEKDVVVETVTETVAPEEASAKRVPETVAPMKRVAELNETVTRKRCPACGLLPPKKSTDRVKKWRAKNERA